MFIHSERRTKELSDNSIHLSVYPNPLTNYTNIVYELLQGEQVKIHLLDLTGRVVETLLPSQWQEKGAYQLEWTPHNKQAGVYFLCAKMGVRWKMAKLILLE